MNNRVVYVVRSHIRHIACSSGICLHGRVCSENKYKYSIELQIATEKQQQQQQQRATITEQLHTKNETR